MKYLLPLLFVLAGVAAYGQTRFDVVMTVDGAERQCIVVRPSGNAPPAGYPVVFMFHGTSGDGEKFYNISGWKEKGEAEKIVTVFPSSLRYCFTDDFDSTKHATTTKWNCGESQQKKCDGVVMKDDIAFVRAIVDTVKHMLPIDSRRIYCSGFSNGGVFASKLAVDMSDVFAAAAAAAGPLNELDSMAPARLVPFAFTIGDADEHIVASLGRSCPFNDTCLLVFDSFLKRYLGVLNLSPAYERDSTALALIYRYTTPATSGAPPSRLLFALLKGLTHEYPNGVNYPVAATNFLWTFFNQYTLPAGVANERRTTPAMAAYPNPASGYLVLKGDGVMTVTLTTLLGQRAFSTTATAGQRIELPRLAGGAYVAEITGNGGRAVSMIVIE